MKKNNFCCSSACCKEFEIEENVFVNYGWSEGLTCTPAGKVRIVKAKLELTDKLGAIAVRLGINRNNYKIPPGLYAVGNPLDQSPVLVTANYKLTFDSLRKELSGLNVWILVLDTKGINVWCAAGKGTFGTEELLHRINQVQLQKVISHKTIILPQLGAPGVAAHDITKNTGFRVIYGPVYAADIPRFLNNNLKAEENMRKVRFALKDRLAVIPVEFKYVPKLLPVLFILLFVYNLINPAGIIFAETLYQTAYNLIPYLVAFVLGTVGIAALLPYLPFRSFALKSLFLGFIWAAIVSINSSVFFFPDSSLTAAANILLLSSITTFFGLNFTGSTTYTSLSGVQKETLYTVPAVAIASLIGIGLAITYKISLFIP